METKTRQSEPGWEPDLSASGAWLVQMVRTEPQKSCTRSVFVLRGRLIYGTLAHKHGIRDYQYR